MTQDAKSYRLGTHEVADGIFLYLGRDACRSDLGEQDVADPSEAAPDDVVGYRHALSSEPDEDGEVEWDTTIPDGASILVDGFPCRTGDSDYQDQGDGRSLAISRIYRD